MAQFRRPASLSPVRAEQIPGEPDPADQQAVAHASARALVREARASVDPAVIDRVVHLVQREGVDDVAALWSGAPADSLPGALWRLYALAGWIHSEPSDVVRRYEAGMTSAPGLRVLAGVEEPPGIDEIRATIDDILRGAFTGDFPIALVRASAVFQLCAYGTAKLADALPEGEHVQASSLTGRAASLLRSGEELAQAARLAADGDLT